MGESSRIVSLLAPIHGRYVQFLQDYIKRVKHNSNFNVVATSESSQNLQNLLHYSLRQGPLPSIHVHRLPSFVQSKPDHMSAFSSQTNNELKGPPLHHVCKIVLTASDFTVLGQRVSTFDTLPLSTRANIASFSQTKTILERLAKRLTANKLITQPINHNVNNHYSEYNMSDWLFLFCIEALNDVRVDEVSFNDYLARLSSSQHYSRLILKVLSKQ